MWSMLTSSLSSTVSLVTTLPEPLLYPVVASIPTSGDRWERDPFACVPCLLALTLVPLLCLVVASESTSGERRGPDPFAMLLPCVNAPVSEPLLDLVVATESTSGEEYNSFASMVGCHVPRSVDLANSCASAVAH